MQFEYIVFFHFVVSNNSLRYILIHLFNNVFNIATLSLDLSLKYFSKFSQISSWHLQVHIYISMAIEPESLEWESSMRTTELN